MTNLALHRPLEDYIRYWETLSPRSLRLIEKLAVSSYRYTSPLHQVQGVDAFEGALAKTWGLMNGAKIKVHDYAWGRDGQTAYLRWVLTFMPPGKARRQWTIIGVSEVMFTRDGLVIAHTDHWDSGTQILSRLKGLGWLHRKIRERLGTV